MTPEQFVTNGEVRLAVYSWGKTHRDNRPVIVLIHGYPDSADVWNAVAEQLSADYFVVAYDVRGAGRSSAPNGSQAYSLSHLVDDLHAVIDGVIDAVSPNASVHLVGHDWGALQGWEALTSPKLKHRIASFSTAAPALDHVGIWFHKRLQKPSGRSLVEFFGQALGSSYMMTFQVPMLPELTWKVGLGRLWPKLLDVLEGVSASPNAWQEANGRNGLGLYRANLMDRLLRPKPQRTDIPVQLLVMKKDRFVPAHLFDGVADWATNLREIELEGGHWALLSHPRAVADAIGSFVATIQET